MLDAVNAQRLRLDWRPLVGLTDRDQGSLVERVIARSVLDEAIEQHNKDVKAAGRAAR